MAQLNGELDGAAMFLAVAQFNRAACACDLRSRMDPETVPGGTIRKNPAKPIRVRNWQVHRYKPDWGRFPHKDSPTDVRQRSHSTRGESLPSWRRQSNEF
jgi:hypothetical protein